MPVIAAYTEHPTRPYVRVTINWADTPVVSYAGVARVDVETGECTPLRPYICYDGWELLLSCGHGTFWDTEAPFDRPFYYITTSDQAPCLPAASGVLFLDTFNRTLVNSWGSTETGILSPLPYLLAGGTVPGDYDVNGGKGRMTITNAGVDRIATVDLGRTDFDLYATFSTDVLALTDATTMRLVGRFVDANNHYQGGMNFQPGGGVIIFLTRLLGGTQEILSIDFAYGTYLPNTEFNLRYRGSDRDFKMKVWQGPVEPTPWNLEATDTPQPTITGTRVGILARRDPANTNPVVVQSTDNFRAVDPCPPCDPVTADTSLTPVELVSDGRFWLKDPVRPCNDQPVPLCANGAPVEPDCGGESAIMFVEVGAEIYTDNSLRVRPMNRRRALSITRPRSDVTTSLVLETNAFEARDQVLELAAPGTPLLFQGPQEYGVPDRYMAIGPVNVERYVSDHRIAYRKVSMPYEAVDRPAGPTQGICGTQVADICELYPTLDDLAATGMTWDQLIRGDADPAIANPDARTWDEVEAEFTDWDDVESGGRTWSGLLEGD